MTTHVCVGLLLLCLAGPGGNSQIVSEGSSPRRWSSQGDQQIRGQAFSSEPLPLQDFVAQLCDNGDMNRVIESVPLNGSGEFFFPSVPQGMYTVRIATRTGAVLAEQMSTGAGVMRIEIRGLKKPNPLAGTVISVAELKHKVPSAALKEAKEANKALKQRNLPGLILHLEKALAFDPNFIAARRNLSNAFLTTKQYDRAADSYHELILLDPHSSIGYLGLSAALMSVYQVQQAEAPARQALDIENGSELGHYLLGCSLAAQGKSLTEALSHLGKANKSFPASHLISARILALEGKKEEARLRLQAYLETGDEYGREEAEHLLNTLY